MLTKKLRDNAFLLHSLLRRIQDKRDRLIMADAINEATREQRSSDAAAAIVGCESASSPERRQPSSTFARLPLIEAPRPISEPWKRLICARYARSPPRRWGGI
jgi:hypothetical protein